MRKFLIRVVLAGVPFGIVTGVFSSLASGEGALLGLVAGAFFGIGMATIMSGLQRRIEGTRPEVDGEEVLFHSPGNHIRGVESVGGWLMLTDQRLLFRPHGLNIQKAEWSAPLSDLVRMEPKRTFGILSNGLRAQTTTGEEHFVVENRESWLREVGLAMNGDSNR